jgi:hypothetical protein
MVLQDASKGYPVYMWPIWAYAIGKVVSKPYPELARFILEIREEDDWDDDKEHEAIEAWLQSHEHISLRIGDEPRKFEL